MHVGMYVCKYVFTCVRIHVFNYMCVSMCVHTSIHTCTCCVYIHITHIYICLFPSTHTCVHIYIYIYTYKHKPCIDCLGAVPSAPEIPNRRPAGRPQCMRSIYELGFGRAFEFNLMAFKSKIKCSSNCPRAPELGHHMLRPLCPEVQQNANAFSLEVGHLPRASKTP